MTADTSFRALSGSTRTGIWAGRLWSEFPLVSLATGSQHDIRSSLSSDLAVLLSVFAVLARRRLRLELVLAHQIDVVTEDLRVVDRHVSEDLAIEVHARGAERGHQPAVRHPALA